MLSVSEYLTWYHSLGFSLGRNFNLKLFERVAAIMGEYEPECILEIGRDEGFTLGYFRMAFPSANIVTVDIVDKDQPHQIVNYLEGDSSGRTVFIHGDVGKILMPFNYDLVLIDGSHTYEGCLKDWNYVKEHLYDTALVIFDDLDHPAGCGKVFNDIDSNKYNKSNICNEVGILKYNRKA